MVIGAHAGLLEGLPVLDVTSRVHHQLHQRLRGSKVLTGKQKFILFNTVGSHSRDPGLFSSAFNPGTQNPDCSQIFAKIAKIL